MELKKRKLEYYIVPDGNESFACSYIQSNVGEKHKYIEIIVTDPLYIIQEKRFHSFNFLVDDMESMLELLSDLKCPHESISIPLVDIKEKNKGEDDELYGFLIRNHARPYRLNYYKGSRLSKVVINDNCESLIVLIDQDYLLENIQIIKTWAKEGQYSVYELGAD